MKETQATITLGLDCDGVLAKKPLCVDFVRRATKWGLPLIPGSTEGVQFFKNQDDIHLLGIYTTRFRWLNRKPTEKFIKRNNLPIDHIVYCSLNYTNKLRRLFFETTKGTLTPPDNLQRIVLIDDSAQKIISAYHELKKDPRYEKILPLFTYVAFGENNTIRIDTNPDTLHIITMGGWDEREVVLDEIREKIAESSS